MFYFPYTKLQKYKVKTAHWKKLNKIFDDSILNPNTVVVISDTSIKNNITASISHIYNGQNIIIKTIHHTINIISTKAELFAIRCEINQVIQVPNVKQIIIITDIISAARHIFDSSTRLYQLHSITIESFLTKTLIILFHFGIALVVINSPLIWQSTKRLNGLRQTLFFHKNLSRNLAKKKNAIQFWRTGK